MSSRPRKTPKQEKKLLSDIQASLNQELTKNKVSSNQREKIQSAIGKKLAERGFSKSESITKLTGSELKELTNDLFHSLFESSLSQELSTKISLLTLKSAFAGKGISCLEEKTIQGFVAGILQEESNKNARVIKTILSETSGSEKIGVRPIFQTLITQHKNISTVSIFKMK